MKRTHICKHCNQIFENIALTKFATHVRLCKKRVKTSITKVPTDSFLKLITEKTSASLRKLKSMLWQDELKTTFILTKNLEIYMYSDTMLGIYCWNYGFMNRIKPFVLNAWRTDPPDTIYTGQVAIENLPELLKRGCVIRRPSIEGNWIHDKKRLLGHEIRVYEPKIFN